MRRRTLILALSVAAVAACSPEPAPNTSPETSPAQDPAPARAMTDPAAVVRSLYEPYLDDTTRLPGLHEQAPWSAAMLRDLDAMMARSEAANEPILDFDPLIDAQDYQLSNVNVTTDGVVENSHATVRARFNNLGSYSEVLYDLVWEDDRWKVDNVRGSRWDLRQIATGG